jgi:hypothetical protein
MSVTILDDENWLKRCRNVVLAAFVSAGPALAVGVALLEPGCFFFGSGPSAVGQGRQYESGDRQYDEFFTLLYQLQVDLGRAPDQEKKIRTDLAAALQLQDASPSELGKRIKKQTEQIAGAGTGLKVQLNEDADDDDEARAEIQTVGKTLTPQDEKVVRVIERAARDELTLMVRMKKSDRQLDKLRADVMTLMQQADARFRKSVGKKKEVEKNLEDAQQLMPLMSTRAREVAQTAKVFIKQLEDAAHTDDGSFAAPPPPPEPEFEEEDAGPPPPPPKGSKPAPAPKKKPTGPAADFEP